MNHHPIFPNFNRTKIIGTGRHTFDFLGIATDASFKKGWEKHAIKSGQEYTADYPPLNEHYFDWIALLSCVSKASGTFRMAELGAGWAPWLVRSVFAARQVSAINKVELLAVEADPTHYQWVKEHFLENQLRPNDYHLIHGAVSGTSTILKFPKIENPDEDYGASLRNVSGNSEFIEVQGYPLESLLNKFSGPLDFLHIDIQGAEYDVIPQSMELLKTNVKAIMIGTHISSEKHEYLRELFLKNNWQPIMIYPRNAEVTTEYGVVNFGDGFLFLRNPQFGTITTGD